jgi:hypothetical protein
MQLWTDFHGLVKKLLIVCGGLSHGDQIVQIVLGDLAQVDILEWLHEYFAGFVQGFPGDTIGYLSIVCNCEVRLIYERGPSRGK